MRSLQFQRADQAIGSNDRRVAPGKQALTDRLAPGGRGGVTSALPFMDVLLAAAAGHAAAAMIQLDGMLVVVQGEIAGLNAARGSRNTAKTRALAESLKQHAERLLDMSHTLLAQQEDAPDDAVAARANRASEVASDAYVLATRTIAQLDEMDAAGAQHADLINASPPLEDPGEVRRRGRAAANLGVCDEKDMQQTELCPLEENARGQIRSNIADTLVMAASNWSDAIQDKHLQVLRKNPEGLGPVVEILISFAFGKLTGLIAAASGPKNPKVDGDGVGGDISMGKAIKGVSKELVGAGKGEMVSNLKAATGDRDQDAAISFLAAIRPTVEKWRVSLTRAISQLADAELVRASEGLASLQAAFSVAAFQAQIDATLVRFEKQVLSIGQGNHIAGTQLVWLFHPRTGDRRMASVTRGTREMKYRGEIYDANSGEWTFVGWIDDDMGHPAIDRAYANRREVLDLDTPGGKTAWTNPDAKELTAWLNGK